MDAKQFDRLAINLTRGVTRRGVAALGVFLAGALLPRNARAQDACGCFDGETCIDGHCWRSCETNRDCRSKQHDDPCINNSCIDGVCVQAIVDCQPGYECCFGECCNKGCETDEECRVFDPCRTGACLNGFCEFTVVDPCYPCVSDTDCLSEGLNTVCCGGLCRRPCTEGMTLGKGCACELNADGTSNGLIVRDDASGAQGTP